MKIYGIKNCQSVKKCLDHFKDQNYEFIDYKKFPPSIEQITQWVQRCGIQKVLNSKGTTYKKLNLKDQNLSLEETILLMHQNPTLIKRPVIETQENLYFGFDKNEKIL